MKKKLSILLAVLLLLSCMLTAVPTAQAEKANEKRAIAIVFDNSGSMYMSGEQAWCRATYAMEVFASMLNAGDILQIYPMWPITIGNQTYSMESPLEITDAAKASTIREIFTPDAGGTPIESIDAAATGLQTVQADKKYLIVLTDGGTFSKNGSGLSSDRTIKELDNRMQAYAGNEMTVMYLAVGQDACIPSVAESDSFIKKEARDTTKVLSTLTELCNKIFGRDTLPNNRISGNSMEFDISMKKLIVFVQGENISDLKITGNGVGKLISSQQTMYSTLGTDDYPSVPDESLQGMIVTYTDCASGTYNIEYTGTANSVEAYYEPDADLAFIFTDAEGNPVDPNELYEGDYKVSFGMVDAKSGQLISSDLLGKPSYRGSYTINGKKVEFDHEGFSGSVDIPLKKGDTFEADLEVEYLSGYRIYKSSKDFGWPDGGITVQPKPIDDEGFRIEITGGASSYPLQQLEEGAPYKAVVYFNDEPLPAEYYNNSDKLSFTCDDTSSNAKIQVTPNTKEGYYELKLHHKDPNAPQNTKCGECTVKIDAYYTPPGSDEAKTSAKLTYNIEDDFATLGVELDVPQDYIVIKDMEEAQEMTVKFTLNGVPVNDPEEFKKISKPTVDCGGIKWEVIPDEDNFAYKIKLLETDGIDEGNYTITVNAQYTDSIGRVAKAEAESLVTLSTMPMWVKWVITLSILLILFIIIWTILHIRVLPTKMHTTRRLSSMIFDGDDVTQSTNFLAEIKKGSAKIQGQYGGRKLGISMDVTPGKESYLYKAQKRRSAEVKVASVRKFGPAKIQEAMIGSAKYVLDEDTGKFVPALPNQKPFPLLNGMMVKFSGTIQDAGVDKDFEVTSKLNFKKK